MILRHIELEHLPQLLLYAELRMQKKIDRRCKKESHLRNQEGDSKLQEGKEIF